MKTLHPASPALALAALCAAPFAQAAEPAADLASLRREMAELRATYEARLQALETRLQAAEAQATPPVAAAPPAPAPAPAAGANSFNPAISLILGGQYQRNTRDPAAYAVRGVPLPVDAEVGPGDRGFGLAESELGLSASVDPWWRGSAAIALHPDDSVSVEEAFVQSSALGHGLGLKVGRFFSGVGYLNGQHAHAWDFADNPLAYQALLGTQLADDGVQLSWLAPTERYLELGLELGRGRSFPGGDNARNGAGLRALTLHTGDDLGDSHSWRAGVSWLSARAQDQALLFRDAAGADLESAFSGRTQVWVLDGVWKWAPGGNATRSSFKLQGEWLRSTREGQLVADPAGSASAGSYRAVQSGWYLQGLWQFMPGWRLGLRTEAVSAATPSYGANAGRYALGEGTARKTSLMLDWGPSEFSRWRLQLAQDRARPGAADTQLVLQYQMSLGAHGAHAY